MNWQTIAGDLMRPQSGGNRQRRPWWVGILALLIAGASYLAKQYSSGTPRASTDASRTVASPPPSGNSIPDLVRSKRSDVVVESAGVVVNSLPDDVEGDRHQRFIVRLDGGETILIAHNIDLGQRVPLKIGDHVSFKGEYVWNDRGGLVHWTHRDPRAVHADGWIELNRQKYQ